MAFYFVYGRRREQFQWHSCVVEPFSVRLDEIMPLERSWATPAIHIAALNSVCLISFTTPSPPEKAALEQKRAGQKQPVKLAREGQSRPRPSRTQDTSVCGGDLAISEVSDQSTKDEDASEKVEKPVEGALCKSSASQDNGQESNAGVAMSKNAAAHQFVGVGAIHNPPIERARRQVPFLSTDSVSPNKPGAFCPETSRPLHAPVAKDSDSQTGRYVSNKLKDLVKDVESDKTDLISATASVLNVLKVVEAKKQEASRAKAAAADGPDDILDKVESSREHWMELLKTNLELAGDVTRNKSCLSAEEDHIKACLLILLKDQDESLIVLDDMSRALEAQLAQVVEDIEKAKLTKLQKERSQKVLLDQELAVEKATEEAQLLKLEAEENSKLKQLFEDYRYEVEALREYMDLICQDVKALKKHFDHRIPLLESATPSKRMAVFGSSVTPSSVHGSEDSESGSSRRLAPAGLSPNKSAASFSSEDCDAFPPTKAAEVAVSTQADPSEAVSSHNTALSNDAGHHKLPQETCSAIPTDDGAANIGEAVNASADTKALSDDDWDLCGHSESDDHSDA
uniref:Uncharacterized protein n=1 Tax=Kalanchoe fedtschenkoi TaxID=63787 RepID=A0A7N0UCW2_KALFE